jgi:hypothetical protein
MPQMQKRWFRRLDRAPLRIQGAASGRRTRTLAGRGALDIPLARGGLPADLALEEPLAEEWIPSG